MTSRRREAATGYGMAIPALIILGRSSGCRP
jgi:hypothetical protein